MVRTEDYKPIVYPRAGEVQLFDIRNDPWETKDLAVMAHADTVVQLMRRPRNLKEVGIR